MEKFSTFVRAAFNLYEGWFWKTDNCFKKNMFLLSLWDLEWRGQKFDFWQYFVRTVVKNIFWIPRTTIWVFLKNFCPPILLRDPSKNCWDLLRKNFGTFVETAFYVYRQTIWRGTNFSKEYSSSYLFVTWRGK